jgi:O-methyltransferase/aklanonic acid methyltransferase
MDAADSEQTSAAKAQMVRMYDKIASTYGTALDMMDVYGRELVAASELKCGDRVVDLGCGRGACLRPAAAAVGNGGFVLGIDISEQMIILLTRDLERDALTNVEVRVGDGDDLDLHPAAFDAITCGFAAHHFTDVTATVTECRSALRPGGRFAASTNRNGVVDYPWVHDALAETGLFPGLQDRSQRPRFAGAPELEQSLCDAGYKPITTTSVAHRFVFADLDAYLTWIRTQGLGTIVNRLDPEHLQTFIDACARRLQPHASPDGYELLKTVDLTIGTRP